MIGAILIIPLLIVRYGLPLLVDKDAMKRAAFTPPVEGREKIAFWVYLLSTFAMLIYLFFITIAVESYLFYIGVSFSVIGLLLYAISFINFGKPSEQGINTHGLYKYSRNPIYVAFFIYLLGCVLITQSLILLALLIVYQTSVHWIVLSEERWCIQQFGNEYIQYMKRVRRYL